MPDEYPYRNRSLTTYTRKVNFDQVTANTFNSPGDGGALERTSLKVVKSVGIGEALTVGETFSVDGNVTFDVAGTADIRSSIVTITNKLNALGQSTFTDVDFIPLGKFIPPLSTSVVGIPGVAGQMYAQSPSPGLVDGLFICTVTGAAGVAVWKSVTLT